MAPREPLFVALFKLHFKSILASKLDPQGPLFEVLLRTGQIFEKVRMSVAGAPVGRVRPGIARERKAQCAYLTYLAYLHLHDLLDSLDLLN